MKLYLVQHGEACTKKIDPERPLTEQGRADIERLAGFLGRAGVQVERIIHSGKLRAQQTAECLASRLAPGLELKISDLINPNDTPAAFDWQTESGGKDTLIVSHLPFVNKLASHLLVGNEDKKLTAYQPGSIACLECNDDLWQLNWMIRPELFNEKQTEYI